MEDSSYWIPSGTVEVEQEIKKSRFIATLGQAATKNEAMSFLENIRQKYPDARHHCWAYWVGAPSNNNDIGMSDDGEPRGTAGKPMLQVLQHQDIGEIVAVVTRYFGGIKLGTGGLARAYSSTLQMALKELPLSKKEFLSAMVVKVPYAYKDHLEHFLEEWEVKIISVEYQEEVKLHLKLLRERLGEIKEKLKNQTSGKVEILKTIENWEE